MTACRAAPSPPCLVDYVLPPGEMPADSVAYATRAFAEPIRICARERSREAMKKIVILLRAQTGHDFANTSETPSSAASHGAWSSTRSHARSYVRTCSETPPEIDALFARPADQRHQLLPRPESFAATRRPRLPDSRRPGQRRYDPRLGRRLLHRARRPIPWPSCSTGADRAP